jgi:hypothetical protein
VDARKVFTPFYKLWQKVEKKPVDTTDLSLLTRRVPSEARREV